MMGALPVEGGDYEFVQEGRLGYEQYAAKGYALWGFDVAEAQRVEAHLDWLDVYGVEVPFDSRDPDLQAKISEATKGRMLDVAFDAVGVKATFEQGLAMLANGGRVVVVGLSGEEASLGSTLGFGLSRKQALGHLGYQGTDIGILA